MAITHQWLLFGTGRTDPDAQKMGSENGVKNGVRCRISTNDTENVEMRHLTLIEVVAVLDLRRSPEWIREQLTER